MKFKQMSCYLNFKDPLIHFHEYLKIFLIYICNFKHYKMLFMKSKNNDNNDMLSNAKIIICKNNNLKKDFIK